MRVERLPPSITAQYVDGGVEGPLVLYGAIEDNRIHAAGGLYWRDGRCWGGLDVFSDMTASAPMVLRWIKRVLRQARQLGEKEVFVLRDEQFATSSRLLAVMGFELCGCHAETGKEIFVCQVSNY